MEIHQVLLRFISITGAGVLLLTGAACRHTQDPPAGQAAGQSKPSEKISPEEDLMREHGVLRRVLLIYGEAARRLEANAELSPEPIAQSADIVRRFVEDYHERLEENYLFPRFEQTGKQVNLVRTLRQQHEAGRQLTDITMRLATPAAFQQPESRRQLVAALREFIRIYQPHAAREDTVLFPAFRSVVSPQQHDALGDTFEKQEDQLFGENGFEKVVEQVAGIEKTLGLYELNQFTPRR